MPLRQSAKEEDEIQKAAMDVVFDVRDLFAYRRRVPKVE